MKNTSTFAKKISFDLRHTIILKNYQIISLSVVNKTETFIIKWKLKSTDNVVSRIKIKKLLV